MDDSDCERTKMDQRLITWGPEILHGPVGAWIAEHEFNIQHEDILNAIRYHTTGEKGCLYWKKSFLLQT